MDMKHVEAAVLRQPPVLVSYESKMRPIFASWNQLDESLPQLYESDTARPQSVRRLNRARPCRITAEKNLTLIET